MKLISSQRTRDETIVAEKRETRDYGVSVSPIFKLFGEDCRLVLDGHHSYEAAILDGVKPIIVELDASDDDRVALLNDGNLEDFLEATRIDSDLYDIETGFDL
jgi:hypothetical protein